MSQEIEDNIENIEKLEGTDIKINPDYYIHKALIKAQECLTAENMEDGFLQFVMIVDHIEILASSAKLLPSNYEDKVEEIKEKLGDNWDLPTRAKYANKRLKIMCRDIFQNKTMTGSLEV